MASTGRDETYYDLLGVGPLASADEIKRAYRRKVLELHPDIAGRKVDPDAFTRVRMAYEVLGNADQRVCYDATMGLGAGRRPVYHRSFSNMFDSLFSGLRMAVHSTAQLSADLRAYAERRRRAG